jgi:hypothetical protein
MSRKVPGVPDADAQRADMKALKKAFEAASKLPEAEQDALAAAILDEL